MVFDMNWIQIEIVIGMEGDLEDTHIEYQCGLRVSIEILQYFPCSGSLVLFCNYKSLRIFERGDYKVFRPKRRSGFSRYWVMVSYGVLV